MNETDQTFAVEPGSSRVGLSVQSPSGPPGLIFSGLEQQLFDYICQSLKAAGIEHMTAGLPIGVIVRTYSDWLAAWQKCEDSGRTQTSPKTGWVSPTPWAEDEKRLKMELGQWLPKACLTIPSFTRVKKDSGAQSGQDDLFVDLVDHARSSHASGLPN
jgi:hypothetical protein